MMNAIRPLLRRIALGYAVISICILMSYIPIYSVSVLAATSLGTGILMVFGTAYTFTVERPLKEWLAVPDFLRFDMGMDAPYSSLSPA